MPRVPDVRAGWCSRLGGGGAPVNKCQHCQKRLSVLVLVVGHVGGHIAAGNSIFGKESYMVHPSGMFLRPSGGRGRRERKPQRVSEVHHSKLGKRCQVGLLGLGFAVGLVGLGFSWEKNCIILATIHLHAFQ